MSAADEERQRGRLASMVMELRRHVRASVMTLRGQHDRALGVYRQILRSEPDDPAALSAVLLDSRRRSAVDETAQYAEAALKRMPSNFLALHALAWVHVSRGQHHQAKAFVERALQSAQELRLDAPPTLAIRVMFGVGRLIAAILRRRRLRHVPQIPDAMASGSRWYEEWKRWALEYLSWYANAYGSGSNSAPS